MLSLPEVLAVLLICFVCLGVIHISRKWGERW